MDWRKLLSAGSQKVPKVIDDLVPVADDVAETGLMKAPALEADEIIGGAAPRRSPIDDIMDAEILEKATPEARKRMDPRLAALLTAGVAGGALMVGGEDSPQVPFAPQAKDRTEAPISEQMEAAPTPVGPAERSMESKMVPPAESMAPMPAPQPSSDFRQLADKAAMQAEDERDNANLLRASENITAGFLYGKPDYSSSDARKKDADRFLDQAKVKIGASKEDQAYEKIQKEFQDEDKLRDPNSDSSKMTRQVLARYGLNVKTAKEAKDAGINVQNILLQEMAATKAKELAEITANGKSTKKASDFVKGAQKQLLKPFQDYQKVDSAYRSIEAFSNDTKTQAGPKDVAMLYDFIKTLDPGSVVREGEISLSRQGMSQLEALGLSVNRITKSDLLTPSFRQGIAQIAKTKRDQAFENYNQIAQPYIQEAESQGLDPSEFGRFNYANSQPAQETQAKSADSKRSIKLASPRKPGAIITTKSGKTLKVNPDGETASEM
jgi:hypothetical protein